MREILYLFDDLTELWTSKNAAVRFGMKVYIAHLKVLVHRQTKKDQSEAISLAGPQEVLSRLDMKGETLSFTQWFNTVDFRAAGELATQLAQHFQTSQTLHTACPRLFRRTISIPMIASVRLAFLFCYHALTHCLMIENILNHKPWDGIVLFGGASEIEQTTLKLAALKKIPVRIVRPHDPILKFKTWFTDYVRVRDRKIHAEKSFTAVNPSLVKTSYQNQTNKKVICMIPSHSLHFRLLVPLAKALAEESPYEVCVLLQNDFKQFAIRLVTEKIPYRFLQDDQSREFRQNYKGALQNLKSCWNQLAANKPFKESFAGRGLNWFAILKKKIEAFFVYSFSEIDTLMLRFEHVFRQLNPKAVFVFSDARFFEAAGAASAKELGIPVFFYSLWITHDRDRINQFDTGNYLLVTNQRLKNYIVSLGKFSERDVHIVGDLQFDDLAVWKRPEIQEKTRRRLGIADGMKIFTVISFYTHLGYTVDDKRQFFKTVSEATQNRSDIFLVIKAHPNEDEQLLKEFITEFHLRNVLVTKNEQLHGLFGISKGIITLTSAAALEAMIADVPVALVGMPGRDYDYYIPLKSGGGTAYAENAKELGGVLDRLSQDEKYIADCIERGHKFLDGYLGAREGLARDNIIKFMTEKLTA